MYVFDTDVLSLLMRHRLPASVLARMSAVAAERAHTTTITLGELFYGALRSSAPQRLLEGIDEVTRHITCLPFDRSAALRYGELRAHLEAKGTPLDDADLRIAAIASARDLILVSGNARHFSRVPGLRYENWLA